MPKWFVDTFLGKDSYIDKQMTLAFIIYILGCSILSKKGDQIHLSFLGSLENIKEIYQYNWSGASLATLYR